MARGGGFGESDVSRQRLSLFSFYASLHICLRDEDWDER